MRRSQRACLQCQQPLQGRADQKFCTSDCKNYYHNRQYRKDRKLVRFVNRQLLHNRAILAKLSAKNVQKLSLDDPALVGFQPFLCTGLGQNGWRKCYEYSFRHTQKTLWIRIGVS